MNGEADGDRLGQDDGEKAAKRKIATLYLMAIISPQKGLFLLSVIYIHQYPSFWHSPQATTPGHPPRLGESLKEDIFYHSPSRRKFQHTLCIARYCSSMFIYQNLYCGKCSWLLLYQIENPICEGSCVLKQIFLHYFSPRLSVFYPQRQTQDAHHFNPITRASRAKKE